MTANDDLVSQKRAEILAAVETARQLFLIEEERLASFDKKFPEGRTAPRRFYNVKPFKAFPIILKENGGRMTEDALIKAFLDDDGGLGKSRGETNPRMSIERQIKSGKLQKIGELVNTAPAKRARIASQQ